LSLCHSSILHQYRLFWFIHKIQQEENERNRKHVFHVSLLEKRQNSIETLWKLIFEFEQNGNLNDDDIDSYIRSVFWLPADLRDSCLQLLNSKSDSNVVSVREALIEAARDYKSI